MFSHCNCPSCDASLSHLTIGRCENFRFPTSTSSVLLWMLLFIIFLSASSRMSNSSQMLPMEHLVTACWFYAMDVPRPLCPCSHCEPSAFISWLDCMCSAHRPQSCLFPPNTPAHSVRVALSFITLSFPSLISKYKLCMFSTMSHVLC